MIHQRSGHRCPRGSNGLIALWQPELFSGNLGETQGAPLARAGADLNANRGRSGRVTAAPGDGITEGGIEAVVNPIELGVGLKRPIHQAVLTTHGLG